MGDTDVVMRISEAPGRGCQPHKRKASRNQCLLESEQTERQTEMACEGAGKNLLEYYNIDHHLNNGPGHAPVVSRLKSTPERFYIEYSNGSDNNDQAVSKLVSSDVLTYIH